MAKGAKRVKVPDVGVDLILEVGEESYDIRPSAGDVLRFAHALKDLPKDGEFTDALKAQLADACLEHLSGEHREFFSTLAPEQQQFIADELWAWYARADQEDPGPFVEPPELPAEPVSASPMSSSGTDGRS